MPYPPSGDATPPALSATDEARLLRARVLESIAGSAWHELAQPLGGLRSFVTMLRLEGVTSDQLGVDPSLVEEAATSAERLARALADLAGGVARPAPLRVVVEDQVALAGSLLTDVAVSIDIPSDVPESAVDPALLRLLVASLLVDAVATLGGPRRARGRIAWGVRAGAASFDLVVDDDGRPAEPGSLSSLRSLLTGQGASIAHEPRAGGGNRVTATLPLTQPPDRLEAFERTSAPAAATPTTGPLVLVCDDDPVVRALIVRSLARAGLRAIATGSGADALEVLDREPVDVVLTDDRMTGMGGRQLHATVAETHPRLGTRFVLMSGDAGDAELVAYAEAERLRVLAKPFELGALAAILREVAAG